jgi:hypothetical protein
MLLCFVLPPLLELFWLVECWVFWADFKLWMNSWFAWPVLFLFLMLSTAC